MTNAPMTALTPPSQDGFIFVEQPLLTAQCPGCQESFKKGLTPTGEEVFVIVPYQIRSVQKIENRYFEKVSIYFRHQCPESGGVR